MIAERLIVELHYEAVLVGSLIHALDHGEVVRPLTMVLVPVDKNVLHEVQLDDSLLTPLLHDENKPWEKLSIFDQASY